MIGALVGRAVTPKLLWIAAGAWLLSLLILWAFMAGHATSVAATAAAEAKGAAETACATARTAVAEAETLAIAAAVERARADWDADQAALDRLAAAQRDRTAAELDRARMRAADLSRQLLAHIHANPPRADGRADPERVRLWNDARRPDPAAGGP